MTEFKSGLAARPATFLILSFLLSASMSFAAQKVPIRFDDYHGYASIVKYLKDVATAYPEIAKLQEIGKSNMGRSVYVLVVSNRKMGTTIDAQIELRNRRGENVQNVAPLTFDQGKPGHWISGAIHGNEFTGTEVCLYIVDKLVSGYGSDKEVTALIDNKSFYICPVVNPDGLSNTLERGISQRQNSLMKDDDGDGKINEDGPDDLNGDGHITQFRYPDPEGQYVIDEADPRLMVRLRRDEKTTKPRYSMITEDKDNDGDKKRGEDPESGIDLNRNFPEVWFTDDGLPGGSGDYPTSAPEVHAVAEFFTNHTNILMSQFYHTSGGFTYRPLGTSPHPRLHPKDVAVFDFIMGKKYLETIGEEVPEIWEDPSLLEKSREELKKTSKNKYAASRGYELPFGWKVSYDEAGDRRYGYGMATDWAYMQYGIYSITTELWNPQQNIKDFPRFEGEGARQERERALLKYQDEKYGGKLFIPWQKFRHPELGEGEIGGWIPKYRGNALPGEPLADVCDKHWRFELFRAGLLPEVVITEAKARVLYSANSASEAGASLSGDEITIKKGKGKGRYRIIEVTATIENKGPLATHVARGAQLPGNREDVVWLIGDRAKISYLQGTPYQRLGVIDGAMKIPGYVGGGPDSVDRQTTERMMFMPPGYPMPGRRRAEAGPTELKEGGAKRQVKWLVAIEGSPPLKLVLSSQKGGTSVKSLEVQ
ncbi:MAG: M14 family metallopeptidase [Candidatus Aminicenantes bacterium]|nr:M14 family metallopeptidase [Candidatus Aminicenantes bacterium]